MMVFDFNKFTTMNSFLQGDERLKNEEKADRLHYLTKTIANNDLIRMQKLVSLMQEQKLFEDTSMTTDS
jgi:hypothetical protein